MINFKFIVKGLIEENIGYLFPVIGFFLLYYGLALIADGSTMCGM